MRKLLLAATAGLCFVDARANAALIYDLNVTYVAQLSNPLAPAFFNGLFVLTLGDGAITSGSASFTAFNGNTSPGGMNTYSNPAGNFISFIGAYDSLTNPETMSGGSFINDNISLKVDKSGNITGGSIIIQDNIEDLSFNLSNGTYTGNFVADGSPSNCNTDPGCFLSGNVTRVPEPSSVLALLAGLGGLLTAQVMRRRSA